MDPTLSAIAAANAQLLRYVSAEEPEGGSVHARVLNDRLNAVCERALADLVPAANATGQRDVSAIAAFLRYLLRSITLRERLGIVARAVETRSFLQQSPSGVCGDHVAAILVQLGATPHA
jgi:transposase